MLEFFTIFLGGSIGAGLRYFIYLLATKYALPYYGTFAVNIIGCFLLGFLMELEFESDNKVHNTFKLFLTTGIVSSFTTFSTFSFEAFDMIINGKMQTAILYMLSSLFFGIGCVILGFFAAKSFNRFVKIKQKGES